MIHEFDAEIHRLEGKIKWNVVYVPFSVQETYGTGSRVPIQVQVDGHSFSSMLLPSQKGHYFVFNKQMRDACQKDLGDAVSVSLQLDNTPRTVEIPSHIQSRLEEQPGLLKCFTNQPDYIKREQLQFIESAKRKETQERRIEKLIDRLQKSS